MISRRDIFRGLLGRLPTQTVPRVDSTRCYAAQGNICEVCYERCPLRPRAVRYSRGSTPAIIAERCDNCGVCVDLCPADAILAATTVEDPPTR
jgi:ferredoxin-type protein NapG